jgi:FkbM family methyltransferase
MHRGEDTEYYLKKGFSIVGIEADPDLANHCRQRFAEQINKKTMIVVEGAIVGPKHSTTAGPVEFYRSLERTIWGTIVPERAQQNIRLGSITQTIKVQRVDLLECFSSFGIPYYMKIDIEGSEMLCLQELALSSVKPAYLSVETDQLSIKRVYKQLRLLEKLGYNRFKTIRQDRVSSQKVPFPAREGNYVNHCFLRHASGLFGRELPGKWKNRNLMLSRYCVIVMWYKLLGERSRFGLRRLLHLSKTSYTREEASRTDQFRALNAKWLSVLNPSWYDTHAQHSSIIGAPPLIPFD